MKKIFCTLCAILLATVLLFAACDSHTHNFSESWSWDSDYHWHSCTVKEDCPEFADKQPHSWDDGVVTRPAQPNFNGEITFTCTICGATKIDAYSYTAPTRTVTEEQWQQIVSQTNNFTLQRKNGDKVLSTFKLQGDVRYSFTAQSGTIYTKTGEEYFLYSQEGENWTKQQISEGTYSYSDNQARLLYIFAADFGNFVFDERSGCYTCAQLDKTKSGMFVFENLVFAFENGSIVSATMNFLEGAETRTFEFSQINATVVDVPNV